MRLLTVLALASIFAAGACTKSSDAPTPTSSSTSAPVRSGPPRVGGVEAKQLVSAGALLLDVRTEEEFADGHIEGARNVPLGTIRGAMASLPRDKPIVVYCAVGSRATAAANMLYAAGYDVRNLGPMAAWNR